MAAEVGRGLKEERSTRRNGEQPERALCDAIACLPRAAASERAPGVALTPRSEAAVEAERGNGAGSARREAAAEAHHARERVRLWVPASRVALRSR